MARYAPSKRRCEMFAEMISTTSWDGHGNVDSIDLLVAVFDYIYFQTWITILIFIFAILLHPEAQRKAQEEIDRVVGSGRLPDFSDRDSLPYLECLLQECRRYALTK